MRREPAIVARADTERALEDVRQQLARERSALEDAQRIAQEARERLSLAERASEAVQEQLAAERSAREAAELAAQQVREQLAKEQQAPRRPSARPRKPVRRRRKSGPPESRRPAPAADRSRRSRAASPS